MNEKATYNVALCYEYNQVALMVERETTEVGKRMIREDGTSQFESIVFDEQYEDLRSRYFLRAGGAIRGMFSAYSRGDEGESYDDYDVDTEDLAINLELPITFPKGNLKAIDAQVYDYMVSYMCQEWFMAKDPNLSEAYRVKCNEARAEIKHLLNMRTRPHVRPYKLI